MIARAVWAQHIGGVLNSANQSQAPSSDLLERAIAFVRSGTGIEDVTKDVEGLVLPSGSKAAMERVKQVEHVVRLLKAYHEDVTEVRPLSIVVFGPPGSGKSMFVKKITAAVKGCSLVTTENLTQHTSSESLARVFGPKTGPSGTASPAHLGTPAETPVYFFDEFDAARDGRPLGWLSCFLAPMEDGAVQVDGMATEIGKAVFLFAGGTANSLDEFNQRAQIDPENYRARKVPDFISRLRGSVDIGGVNELGDTRIVSRALALRYQLKDDPTLLTDAQIRQVLTNGHFVHGNRSLRTLVSAWDKKKGRPELPKAILDQHFSRGELDGQVIGISAGLVEPQSDPMLLELTSHLLRSGATLAYAGALLPDGTLQQVMNTVKVAPQELFSDGDARARVRSYLGHPASKKYTGSSADEELEFIPLATIGAVELEEIGAPAEGYFAALPIEKNQPYDPARHVAWALSLFRLRVRVLQDVSALVVLGGKDDGHSWGRMAGIAEEVMIALALQKPVYVLGGSDGAARAVGQLLGLDGAPVNLEQCLIPSAFPEFADAIKPFSSRFEIPGIPESPRNISDLRRFLFHRGLTTSAWPWNGLTPKQNRKLFACGTSDETDGVQEAVGLILQGLSRIEWKTQEGGVASYLG